MQDWWEHARRLQTKEHRKGFDTLFMLVIWLERKERNARLFDQHASTTQELTEKIKQEIHLWMGRSSCLKHE
ncbi:hypothetical protein BAE44_0002982 [Dichanthelium oligosanthes]|uniref:Uncharacterized protein n=1 Tax=Dichanthelium oligosanthes TaxID=888268 RepID=A0A1E5WF07_9POAL|nr:hypothetical protein BAE44_0002982 [Dichanthelium oligosanthes]